MNEEGEIVVVPVVVLDRKLGKVGHKAAVYLLVQWSTGPREAATWELYSDIEKRFHILISQHEVKLFKGGSNDTGINKARA